MSKPTPPLYDLEFSEEVDFWIGGNAFTRCTFLMPVSPPSEFLAFGVLRPSEQVLFVARGKVQEHLGDFISRMVQAGAQVELYVRAPVPGWLIKKYTSDPPFEGHEYEDPQNPPVNGLMPINTQSYSASSTGSLWTEGEARTRRALLVPVREPSQFLALGVTGSPDKVHFALQGSVQEQLGELIARMVQEQARVELYARPPLPEPLWRKHLSEGHGG